MCGALVEMTMFRKLNSVAIHWVTASASGGVDSRTYEAAMYAVAVSLFFCWLALGAVQVPNGSVSDLAHTAPLSNQAGGTSGPLRLEVTEPKGVAHQFPGGLYGVTITNMTDSAVSIERGILIEAKTQRKWNPAGEIQALADCTHYIQSDFKPPTFLAARSSLAVRPWNRLSCGSQMYEGQCIDACMQNARAKPGTYRFVVILLPDRTRIASPPFLVSGP
jgi:hypothetical protein